MKKITFLFSLVLFGFTARAQFDDLSHIDTFIYNKVYKNIAAYNIKYARFDLNGTADNSPFKETDRFFFENFLPDWGARIGMVIEKLPLIYPDTAYKLYRVTLNHMSFQNKDKVSLTRGGINPGTLFLVGVNPVTGAVKYISGQFFISAIAADFKVNLNDPASLILFLSFKTYSLGLEQIKFSKRVGGELYYSAVLAQKTVSVIVNSKTPEVFKLAAP